MPWVFLLLGAVLALWAYFRAQSLQARRRSRRGRDAESQVAAAVEHGWRHDASDPHAAAWAVLREPMGFEHLLERKAAGRHFRLGAVFGVGWSLLLLGLYLAIAMPPAAPARQPSPAGGTRVEGGAAARADTPAPPGGTSAPSAGAGGAAGPAQGGAGAPPGSAGAGGSSPAPAGSPVTVTVTAGDSVPQVAARLEQAGVIRDRQEFLRRLVERRLDTSLQAGTFRIPPDQSVDAVIDILTRSPS